MTRKTNGIAKTIVDKITDDFASCTGLAASVQFQGFLARSGELIWVYLDLAHILNLF
jgi:hypothetical protein